VPDKRASSEASLALVLVFSFKLKTARIIVELGIEERARCEFESADQNANLRSSKRSASTDARDNYV
jgi:hypothetical protein